MGPSTPADGDADARRRRARDDQSDARARTGAGERAVEVDAVRARGWRERARDGATPDARTRGWTNDGRASSDDGTTRRRARANDAGDDGAE